MSASRMPTRNPMFRRATARLAVTVDLPTPPLPEATAITWAMPPVEVLSFGSGRGAAPPSLTTTSTSLPGNAARSCSSAWFLIFTANGSRVLAKRSTTVTLPSAAAVCSMNPLATMSFPVSGWTTVESTCFIFSSIIACMRFYVVTFQNRYLTRTGLSSSRIRRRRSASRGGSAFAKASRSS